jgi:hypothetical protein
MRYDQWSSTPNNVPIVDLWLEGLILLRQLTEQEMRMVLDCVEYRLQLAKHQIIAEYESRQQPTRP